MRIQRTANAGVLLELDGKRILLDGVCEGHGPYLATPGWISDILLQDLIPDALIYTHRHPDHYDELFVSHYLQNTAGPIIGPADIPYAVEDGMKLGDISIVPINTRHIGRTDGCMHRSYVLQGSQCVWFLGDASLLDWKRNTNIPKPDVIIAPFGFVTDLGWEYCVNSGAKIVVIVHMPSKAYDPYNLWSMFDKAFENQKEPVVFIPELGEVISLS